MGTHHALPRLCVSWGKKEEEEEEEEEEEGGCDQN